RTPALSCGRNLVEAPGTAPGSEMPMPQGVYRHSRFPDRPNIGAACGFLKPPSACSAGGAPPTVPARSRRPFASEPSMSLRSAQSQEIDELRAQQSPTRRATVAALEEVLYEALPVLDHGFVRVVDYMGDDAAVVQAA